MSEKIGALMLGLMFGSAFVLGMWFSEPSSPCVALSATVMLGVSVVYLVVAYIRSKKEFPYE